MVIWELCFCYFLFFKNTVKSMPTATTAITSLSKHRQRHSAGNGDGVTVAADTTSDYFADFSLVESINNEMAMSLEELQKKLFGDTLPQLESPSSPSPLSPQMQPPPPQQRARLSSRFKIPNTGLDYTRHNLVKAN